MCVKVSQEPVYQYIELSSSRDKLPKETSKWVYRPNHCMTGIVHIFNGKKEIVKKCLFIIFINIRKSSIKDLVRDDIQQHNFKWPFSHSREYF